MNDDRIFVPHIGIPRHGAGLVAQALRRDAAAREREARLSRYSGPAYAEIRAYKREQATKLREVADMMESQLRKTATR